MFSISTDAADDSRTNDEIIASIKAGNRDDIEKLWLKNLRLVRWIIDTKIKPSTPEDREDLEQQAFFGFMRSVKSYEIGGNAKFSSWLVRGIYWELKRYYNRGGYIIHIPAYMKKQIARYYVIIQRRNAAGEALDDTAIMEEMGIPPPEYETMIKAIERQKIASLNSPIEGTDGEMTIQDTIPDAHDVEAETVESMYLQELHYYMSKAVARLPETERAYITARYYLGHSMDAIADIYGCTKQNVDHRLQYAREAIRRGRYSKILRMFL